MRRTPWRSFQVVVAIALGVALFVSSYSSIRGIDASIRGSARTIAGNAEWIVSGSGPGTVPNNLLGRIRHETGAIAAPFLKASISMRSPLRKQLQVWGVDTETDTMAKFFGGDAMPSIDSVMQLMVVPNAVLVPQELFNTLKGAKTLSVVTRSGKSTLYVVGAIPDSIVSRALGGSLAFMNIDEAERLFGQPRMADFLEVSGVSRTRLQEISPGFAVRHAGVLSAPAQDALQRIQSLYALSLIAMLIGGFAVFTSVQVSFLERMKEIATFRAIGASRLQLLSAILVEWLIVGAIGAVLGVFVGLGLATVVVRYVAVETNAVMSIIENARPEMDWTTFALGAGSGLAIVFIAVSFPAIAAICESPLLALKPHTYRLRSRQGWAFGIGLILFSVGLVLSSSGSYAQTLVSIALSFFGLGLILPRAVMFLAKAMRGLLARVAGFAGFLAVDNLQKAPQRTAFNVIVLGGALIIMVATAVVSKGLAQSIHSWIRSSLPFDVTVSSTDFAGGLYGEETVPASLLKRIARLPGVAFSYGVREATANVYDNDVLILGVPVSRYIEAHRRKGSLAWVKDLSRPQNVRQLEQGTGAFVSDNFEALTGSQVGGELNVPTPSGERSFRILGTFEDYSWPRGLVLLDLGVMQHLWKSDRLSYIDIQAVNTARRGDFATQISEDIRADTNADVFPRDYLLSVSDSVLAQSTAAADMQVWLAAVIGFLGIGNSLLVGVLQRQREIGLLRAMGMSRRQLQRTTALEAAIIGVGAGLLGAVGGVIGGWLPLRHFTFAVTGFLYPLVVPWWSVLEAVVAGVIIAVVAALIPIKRVSEVPVLESITMD